MKQKLYLALKAANLVLATVWSFALVFVLIRVLGHDDYATAILLSALGSYVMASDLGFSSVVYQRVRQAFLDGHGERLRPMAVTAFGLYGAIVLLAVTVIATQAQRLGSEPLHLAFVLYFAGFVAALPWNIVRSVAAATDNYLRYETAELLRRVLSLGSVLAMLAGMSFTAYTVTVLAIWLAAYAYALPAVTASLQLRSLKRSDWQPRLMLRENQRQMGSASVFSLLEFAIYNFPYLALPWLLRLPAALIPFDVFFKVTRFGAQAYQVANEGTLPASTRAIHGANPHALTRVVATSLGLSAVPCLGGALLIGFFGEPVFGLLLKDATLVTETMRWCMVAMLVCMMFQATAGTLLLNTGHAPLLMRISAMVAGCMLAMSAAAWAADASLDTFMTAYVAIFALGAVTYFAVLVVMMSRFRRTATAW